MGGLLSAVTALVLAASPVHAALIEIDQTGVSGGTITYDGVGGGAIGTDIAFGQIVGQDTPFHSGVVLTCFACTLSFETGANTSEGPIYQWAGGGNFTLTGSILAGGGFPGFTGTILSGTWNGALFGPSFNIFGGQGTDTKADALVEFYYGASTVGKQFNFSNTEIQGPTDFLDNGGFTMQVDDADITNRIPVPGSSLLMLLGLTGLALSRRRRS